MMIRKNKTIIKREWIISDALYFLKKNGVKENKYNNHLLELPWGMSNTCCSALDYLNKNGFKYKGQKKIKKKKVA